MDCETTVISKGTFILLSMKLYPKKVFMKFQLETATTEFWMPAFDDKIFSQMVVL